MIINLIQDKTNQIKVSYSDQANVDLLNQSFSTKTLDDILSWQVYNMNINTVTFTIISNSLCYLYDINLQLPTIIGLNNYKIETSIDYTNWYELPYKDNTGYIFTKTDSYGNITYLYNNFEFQMLRFTFTGLTNIFDYTSLNILKFLNLEILIDEPFDSSYIKKNLLSIKGTYLTKPNIYDENPFLNEMILTFMNMLEENNMTDIANEYKTSYLQKTNFDILYTS